MSASTAQFNWPKKKQLSFNRQTAMPPTHFPAMIALVFLSSLFSAVLSGDTNSAYSPCSDTTVKRSDGFTFGIAFAPKNSFVFNSSQQLSPCDSRLSLSSAGSQISVFRPKIDEISLLTINTSSFAPVCYFSIYTTILIIMLVAFINKQ